MLYNLFENRDFVSVFAVALLAEGVDRNFDAVDGTEEKALSPSSRRAWIEIGTPGGACGKAHVALLAEGVDRNSPQITAYGKADVALLAEGVDRNIGAARGAGLLLASPSSRRAWIEILHNKSPCPGRLVALLAEGVDRNNLRLYRDFRGDKSPSSRRAWIEIQQPGLWCRVVLRRPPRGGRG